MATYIPTKAMAEAAAQALRIRDTRPPSQQGLTLVGLNRARDIISRRPMSEDIVRRMKAFFDRHIVDKQGATWSDKGKRWVSWHAWGGDAGYTWSKDIVKRLNLLEDRTYSDITDDIAYNKSNRRYIRL
jgi:hypothetical protein